MTRIVVCLSLALAAAAPASGYCRPYGGRAGYSLPEESAAKVIAEYKRASGGNGPFKSLIMTGTLVTADGAAGTFSLHTAAPDHLRVDIDAPGLKLYECYNGKS
ncbi:MAG TPA: hypothetical protein VJX67_00305, partial [Blastocatellia bacterium]|nr:hypothetical protein [Blastocatellia bacterium]